MSYLLSNLIEEIRPNSDPSAQIPNPVDTGHKLNVHKTFNLYPVSTGKAFDQYGVAEKTKNYAGVHALI